MFNKLITLSLLRCSTVFADPRSDNLRAHVRALPDVRPVLVNDAVDAALTVETPDIPASLLLSIAWSESRFEPGLRTGRVCGALQVNPHDIGQDRRECLAWAHSTVLGFAAGVTELRMLLSDPRVHGNLYRALGYRACGNSFFDGTCHKMQWPGWVLERAERLGAGD